MEFVNALYNSLNKNSTNYALFFEGKFFTYKELSVEVLKVRNLINEHVPETQKHIGLVANNDIYTYASILAIWFEAKTYIPVNLLSPLERNTSVFKQTDVTYVIDSNLNSEFANDFKVLNPKNSIETKATELEKLKKINDTDLAYILFTSGTTGKPKGVPISFANLNSFVNALNSEKDFKILDSDRCLQMFEFTFDVSVHATVLPLIAGACLYTIPKNQIKYLYIFKLLIEHKLTVLNMVPSIINYLSPYFSEIKAPFVRFSTFAGSALENDIIKGWQKCTPNSIIYNCYGPTECTIYSSYYKLNSQKDNKTKNGIISIGKPLQGIEYIVLDENLQKLAVGEKGELCLTGSQLTEGYWKNDEKNKVAFFDCEEEGETVRYYKTGDLCLKDADGDTLYLGRIDNQVKLRGYRVELSEVEYRAKQTISNTTNVVALAILNSLNNLELCLAIEGEEFDTTNVIDHMKLTLPNYMIPGHVCFFDEFPHNVNGKVDKNALKKNFKLN